MALLGSLSVLLDAQTAKFSGKLDALKDKLDKYASKADSVALKAGAAFAALGGAIGVTVKAASDLEENTNVLNQTFGAQAASVMKWSKSFGQSIGRSELVMREFASGLQSMLMPMVENQEAASAMSIQMSKLAVDLGSFFNVADSDALTALKAGLSGEIEPMKKFGIVMSESILQQYALSKGIMTSVQKMSVAQKTALRYQFIMDKTKQAQGDAARTADGFANRSKALGAALQDLRAIIGKLFIDKAAENLGIATSAIRGFAAAIEASSPKTKALIQNIGTTGLTALGAVAGIAAMSAAYYKVSSAVISASTAVAGFSKKLVLLLVKIAPVVLMVAGIALAIGLAKSAWDRNIYGIRDSTKKAIDSMKTYLEDFWKGFKKVLDGIGKFGIYVSSKLGVMSEKEAMAMIEIMEREGATLFDDAGVNLQNAISGAGGSIADSIGKPLLEQAVEFGKEMKEQLGFAVEGLDSLFGDQVRGAIDKAKGFVPDIKIPTSKSAAAAESTIGSTDAIDKIARAGASSANASTWGGPLDKFNAAKKEVELTMQAVGILKDSIASAVPKVGGLMSAVATGISSGSPLVAAAAIGTNILSGMKSFKIMADSMERIITTIQQALDPILAPLSMLFSAVMDLIGEMIRIFIALEPLTTVLQALTPVFLRIAVVIQGIADMLVKVFNDLIEKIANLVGKIKGSWGNAIRKLKIDTEETHEALGNAFDIADKLAETGREHANLPAGWKVALDRFNAMSRDASVPGQSMNEKVSGGDTYNIYGVNITGTVSRMKELFGEIKSESEWQGRSSESRMVTSPTRAALAV